MTITKTGTLPTDQQPHGRELAGECPCCGTGFTFQESEGTLVYRGTRMLWQVKCPLYGCGWKVEVAE